MKSCCGGDQFLHKIFYCDQMAVVIETSAAGHHLKKIVYSDHIVVVSMRC